MCQQVFIIGIQSIRNQIQEKKLQIPLKILQFISCLHFLKSSMSTCSGGALAALMCSLSTSQIAGCPLALTAEQQNLAHLWLQFDADEDRK